MSQIPILRDDVHIVPFSALEAIRGRDITLKSFDKATKSFHIQFINDNWSFEDDAEIPYLPTEVEGFTVTKRHYFHHGVKKFTLVTIYEGADVFTEYHEMA